MAIRGYTSYIVMDRNGVYAICMYTYYIYIYRKREGERGTVYVNIKLHALQQQFDHNNQSGIYIYSIKMEETI